MHKLLTDKIEVIQGDITHQRVEALVFDMDGVIVDSERHWKQLEGFFLQQLIPHWDRADQGKITGLSLRDTFALLRDSYGLKHTESEFLDVYQDMAAQIYMEKVALLPGFTGLLDELRAHEVPLALTSSSLRSWIEMVLARFSLHDAFRVVVSAEELKGEGKPSPAIYIHTAKELGVPAARCIVIEDSRNGVLSAKAAGMYCIGLRNGFNEEQDLSGADIIVHGFHELNWQRLQALL